MKKFLIKNISFFTIGLILLALLCEGIMSYPSAFRAGFFTRWFDTYQVVVKSQQRFDSDTLFIGDSVAGQLFPPKEQKNSFAYTAAILIPGQYIIAYNAIQANPNLTHIILICHPKSLGEKFEKYTTYGYFVKPFYFAMNFKHISPLLRKKIESYPYSFFYPYAISKVGPFGDLNFARGEFDENYLLSDISLEYLKRIQDLAKDNDIVLKVVSSPVRAGYKLETNNWEFLRSQIKSENLSPLFKDYFESINYLDEERFVDDTHIDVQSINHCKDYLLDYLHQLEL